MSSFNYTDNYTGFNDLINRADFLTEAKIGKAHPSFKGLAGRIKKDPRSGGKGFPRDARMLIKTVLYGVDIFKDEDLATLKAAGVEASSKYRETLEALLDKYEDVIKSKAGKIADKLEDEFERFVNDQALMVGADRKEAYLAKKEAKDAADAFEKEIQGGGDVVDAVDDAVGELEQGTADAFKGLQDAVKRAKEDPTTFVEIVLKDIDKAEDVKALVAQYANKDGVEVIDNPPTVEFSADADSPLADAVKRHGEDKVGAAIRRDVAKIADNAVVVMAPLLSKEEDYEIQDEPNEYEEDINDMNDSEEEDAEYKGIKQKFSPKYAKKVEDEFKDHVKLTKDNLGVKLPPGNKEEIEDYKKRGYVEDNEFDDFDIGPQSDENVPDDYEEVLKAMVTKDKEQFAKNMIEDEEGGFTKARVLVAFAPEHSPEEMQANVDRYLAAAKKLGVKAKAGKIDDEVAEVYVDSGPASKEMKILGDLQRDMLQATGYFGGEDEEERIVMQPMLETRKTDTSVYLTEQSASDKRNKKSEVKNQSFKERYKPKTHWQLEELRRYGL
jgi:hypothetical protein